MIKNHIVIIPFSLPWNWSADYLNQTALILRRQNIVIRYMWHEVKTLKEILMEKKLPELAKLHLRNLYIFTPIYLVPFIRFEFIRQLNLKINILFLKGFVKYLELKTGFKGKICWVFYPGFWNFWKLLGKEYFLIYDCVDFFTGKTEEETNEIRKNEVKLAKEADLVVANSKVLKKHLSKYRKGVCLVPQGFRIQDFQKKTYKAVRIRAKKPIIGFVGAVNFRIDYGLLLTLAEANPWWSFIIWGPLLEKERLDSKSFEKMQALLNLPNVIHGYSKKKEEVPGIISQFDIAIIPYNASLEFNKYCYPMKLFEYFYMGKPVVSTPIEELKRFPKYIKIEKNYQEWEKIIKNLLSKPWPNSYKIEQRKIAKENSWEMKVKGIISAIRF